MKALTQKMGYGIVYGIGLQFRLDLRSKSLLVTCYLVPLVFYAIMGGIFTSVMPGVSDTLIQSMTVMGVSMGALIGVPPTLAEIYGTDVRRMYQAGGVPLSFGLAAAALSAFIHLMIMSGIICVTAPLAFGASLPQDMPRYVASLALFLIVSLSIACALGVWVRDQAKLTMFSQLIFLPSIMLSGILFPSDLLPEFLQTLGRIFPAAWGYRLMAQGAGGLETAGSLTALTVILILACILCALGLRRRRSD